MNCAVTVTFVKVANHKVWSWEQLQINANPLVLPLVMLCTILLQVYCLGTILSMQIPFVGFQPVQSSEHMAVSRGGGLHNLMLSFTFFVFVHTYGYAISLRSSPQGLLKEGLGGLHI